GHAGAQRTPTPPGTRSPGLWRLWPTRGGAALLSTLDGLYRWRDGAWVADASLPRASRVECLDEDARGHGVLGVSYPVWKRGTWEWSPGVAAERLVGAGTLTAASVDLSPG